MMCRNKYLASTVPLLIGTLCLLGCDNSQPEEIRETGGDYPPVTRDMLSGAVFTGRTGNDRQYDGLQWTFQDETFRITAGENGLPPRLMSRLLPDPMTANEITGKWSVADEVITVTHVEAGGKPVDQPPRTLPTMFTGVLRISAGGQYKFVQPSTRYVDPGNATGTGKN